MRARALLLAVVIVCINEMALAERNSQSIRHLAFDRGSAALPWDSPCRSGPVSVLQYPRWNVQPFLGGAATPGDATLTLKSTGPPLFNQTEQTINVDLSGVLVGLSLGCALTDNLSCRIEAFDLVPSSEASQIVTALQTGNSVAREFISHFHWDGVRGEGVVRLWGGLAFVGGLRYESLNIRLVSTASASSLSGTFNEGNAIFHAFNLYCGAEYTLSLPYACSLVAKVAGFPCVYCHWDYNMPFQDPASPSSPIENSASGPITKGAFGEILIQGSHGLGFAEVGVFTKLSAITLEKTIGINAENASSLTTLQQPFDMRFTRRTIEAGGFVRIAF